MMLRLVLLSLACAAALHGCRAESQGSTAPPGAIAQAPSGLAVIPLQVRAGEQVHRFRVEVAASEEEQSKGLMFRQSLGPDAGMIFPFAPPRPASFWMKNTVIPLDMIFIRADGSVARVEVNTVPYSETPVSVGEPVAAVLEIAGGRSVELGIDENSKVSWPGGPVL
jgi:uncharacterized membrane protein (UPF0127 family)